MVLAPQRPGEAVVDARRRWKRPVIAVVVLGLIGGLVVAALVAGGEDAAGPGPEGVVGPAGPAGPQTPPGPDAPIGPTSGARIEGSGTIVTDVRSLTGFNAIVVAGEGNIVLRQGEESVAGITSDDNLVPLVTTVVSGSTLHIDQAAAAAGRDLDPSDNITIEVTAPGVSRVEIIGAGSFTAADLAADDLEVVVGGAAAVEIGNLVANHLSVNAKGAGSVHVGGTVGSQDLMIEGVIDYRGEQLRSRAATVDHRGVGSVVLWVTDTLEVTVRDLGSVAYFGNPAVTSHVSGFGTVSPLGPK